MNEHNTWNPLFNAFSRRVKELDQPCKTVFRFQCVLPRPRVCSFLQQKSAQGEISAVGQRPSWSGWGKTLCSPG